MADRWATFDCYGTLIDWDRGVRDGFASLWPDADADRLLARYHAVEPLIQEGRELRYREVLARAAEAVAAIEGLELATGDRGRLADSLPSWEPFPEVPGSLAELRARGWRLAALSNTDPDLLAASIERIGVEFDLRITAAEAGSYKPAPGHWRRFAADAGELDRHVHVAASLFHDVTPCAELGIPCVWINRLDERSELPCAAELTSLSGLADVLERAG
jgi:2-haloacid dehalogenase